MRTATPFATRVRRVWSLLLVPAIVAATLVTGAIAGGQVAAADTEEQVEVVATPEPVVEPAVEPEVEPAEPSAEPAPDAAPSPTLPPTPEPTASAGPETSPEASPEPEPVASSEPEPAATASATATATATVARAARRAALIGAEDAGLTGAYFTRTPETNTIESTTGAACANFEFPTGSGDDWSRYPCATTAFPEGPLTALPPIGAFAVSTPNDDEFSALIDARNDGTSPLQSYYLEDHLSRAGDGNDSTFATHLTGPVSAAGFTGVSNPGNIIVEYSSSSNACTLLPTANSGGCVDDWTAVFPSSNPRAVTAYRIRFAPNMQFAPGGRMLFSVPLLTGYTAIGTTGEAAWDSFTFSAIDAADAAVGYFEAGESNQAGVVVPESLSIGNRVWRDSDDSGTRNAVDDTDSGIAGVTVELFRDFDADGTPDNPALDTTTTDANGYYLFDDLVPDFDPAHNRYLVGIAASNFTGGALDGLRSSTGDARGDGLDAGIDIGSTVISSTIELTSGAELTGETELSGAPRDGAFSRGSRGEADANSNLAVDFGFTADETFAIGNRVFKDSGANGAGGFNAGQRNNGLQDSNEAGVGGVRVELYRDGNGNGSPGSNEFVSSTVTAEGNPGSGRPGADANGYYLFDGLDAGTYFVVIPATEFEVGDALGGWHSSTFNGTETVGAPGSSPATDLDDNGIEPATRRPDLGGVRSGAIVLTAGTDELTAETDTSLIAGADSTPDNLSNLAVDFGFIPPMSIGNRIWLDDSNDPAQWSSGGSRNNALLDATDDGNLALAGLQNAGIANVDLQLYLDANNNSLIDVGDTLVASTTSTTTGYYLFDGLAPGNYLVRIPSTEFGIGQPLNGLVSSFDAVSQVSPTNQTDDNDNGVDNSAPSSNGIVSRSIQLVYLAESITETDNAPTLPRGRFTETDADSDLTVDFGFVRAPLSIGNQVWLDEHPTNQSLRNNGLFDSGESALANVEVALYRDLDADGIVDAGEDTGLRDTTTSDGFYLFHNLPAGNYIVAVTEANFTAGGPLENHVSSRSTAPNPAPADNQVDNNDNGVDAAVSGVGVISSRINLAAGAEPTTESPVNDPADGVGGRGSHGELNSSSDLSVDFGFYVPMSLGNRVWLDDSTSPANWASARNNGLLDASADDRDNPNISGQQGLGVAGVLLRLYRDLDADGVIDAGEDSGRTTTSNANGYYLFDGLSRGSYIVGVEASNFSTGAPLTGFVSSYTASAPTDNDVDNTDDGVGAATSPTFGVVSPSILLSHTSASVGAETTGETDPTPQTQASRGANGERNAFSNLTVDFGFTAPAQSIGNRVWIDVHPLDPSQGNNGVHDSGEAGTAAVSVSLYLDANADGIPDGPLIASTVTDANGYYLFGNLPAGGYLVGIDSANFEPGGALTGYVSKSTPTVADNQVDNDDNGIDGVGTSGVLSSPIALTAGDEPTGESPTNGRGSRGELDASSDLTVDFGFVPASVSLGDFVWFDTNGDGVQDTGEPGIAGVMLTVETVDGDLVYDITGGVVPVAFTSSTGAYSFDSLPVLPAGEHYVVRVDETSPALADHTATIPGAGVSATDSSTTTSESGDLTADGQRDASLDFGFVRSTVSVGDSVWIDLDRDGVRESGEPGLAGVTLALEIEGIPVTDVLGSTVEPITTNSTGAYLFDKLPPLEAGEHYIVYVNSVPDGYVPTITGAGTAATDSSEGSAESGDLVDDGDADLTLDFGFTPVVAIGDFAWVDADRDGVQDSTEPGLAGVTVSLVDANGLPAVHTDGSLVVAVTTDANGAYLFDDLFPGDYTLTFGAVTDYHRTITGAGAAATDSDAAPTTGVTASVSVATTATGDTRDVVVGDGVIDALFINPTVDAGYVGQSNDLAITATYGGLVTATRQVSWTLTVTNVGPDTFAGPVDVTVALPAGQSFVVAGSDASCAAVAQVVTCSVPGAVTVGADVTLTVVTRFTGYPSALSIEASVDGGDFDYLATNNRTTASVPSGALPSAPDPHDDSGSTPPPAASGGTGGTTPEPAVTATATPEPTDTATAAPEPAPSTDPTQGPAEPETADSGDPLAFLPWGIGAVLLSALLIGAGVFLMRRRMV